MIKVIAFDFGGVLGPDADDWSNTFKQIPKLTGLTESILQNLFNLHWPKLKTGEESMKTFWSFVALESKNKIKPERLRRTYNNSIFVNRGILKLIRELKKKYQVVLLANDSDDDYIIKTKKLKLNKIFDKLYCSSQLGISKPNPEIFNYVLKDLGIKPQEALFIDNQEDNIKTAESLGINSILFTNYTETVTHIKKCCN